MKGVSVDDYRYFFDVDGACFRPIQESSKIYTPKLISELTKVMLEPDIIKTLNDIRPSDIKETVNYVLVQANPGAGKTTSVISNFIKSTTPCYVLFSTLQGVTDAKKRAIMQGADPASVDKYFKTL